MPRRAQVIVCASAAALFTLVSPLGAGPLNPPAGPIASTPGPEPRTPINATTTPGDADSLFNITQPGSYYLTGNVTGVSGRHGIEINSNNVTIDLNGFALIGVGGSFNGITALLPFNDLTIRNGVVTGWGSNGVDIGINGAGYGAVIEGVCATSNFGVGIYASNNATITSCVVRLNGMGINAPNNATISGCDARENTGSGFSTGSGCTLINCSARLNTGDGFALGAGSAVTNCSSYQNTRDGFLAGSGSIVTGCTAGLNGSDGFSLSVGSSIVDSVARANTNNGITVTNGCIVRGNVCDTNGSGGDGAGIFATGSRNRIEANNCTSADRGIDVNFAGNVIVRNTASNNTLNWELVTGNVCLIVNAATAGAISGNSGGVAPGSTDPSANFTY